LSLKKVRPPDKESFTERTAVYQATNANNLGAASADKAYKPIKIESIHFTKTRRMP
jgi:hypothetical protein